MENKKLLSENENAVGDKPTRTAVYTRVSTETQQLFSQTTYLLDAFIKKYLLRGEEE